MGMEQGGGVGIEGPLCEQMHVRWVLTQTQSLVEMKEEEVIGHGIWDSVEPQKSSFSSIVSGSLEDAILIEISSSLGVASESFMAQTYFQFTLFLLYLWLRCYFSAITHSSLWNRSLNKLLYKLLGNGVYHSNRKVAQIVPKWSAALNPNKTKSKTKTTSSKSLIQFQSFHR